MVRPGLMLVVLLALLGSAGAQEPAAKSGIDHVRELPNDPRSWGAYSDETFARITTTMRKDTKLARQQLQEAKEFIDSYDNIVNAGGTRSVYLHTQSLVPIFETRIVNTDKM